MPKSETWSIRLEIKVSLLYVLCIIFFVFTFSVEKNKKISVETCKTSRNVLSLPSAAAVMCGWNIYCEKRACGGRPQPAWCSVLMFLYHQVLRVLPEKVCGGRLKSRHHKDQPQSSVLVSKLNSDKDLIHYQTSQMKTFIFIQLDLTWDFKARVTLEACGPNLAIVTILSGPKGKTLNVK